MVQMEFRWNNLVILSLLFLWTRRTHGLKPQEGATSVPHYAFKEYSYVALPKYETQFQEFQSACQQSPSCQLLEGVDLLNCVRECISPSCYIELYQGDKLEVGELDVRLDSFKGCFAQRGGRRT